MLLFLGSPVPINSVVCFFLTSSTSCVNTYVPRVALTIS